MKSLRYGIIGNGRLACHMQHYFNLLNIPHKVWARKTHTREELSSLEQSCHTILILIKDEQIESFIQQNPDLQQAKLVHCSGQLITPLAFSAHPLMSFNHELYDLELYQQIAFILEEGSPDFYTLFPGLNNPFYTIPKSLKPFYHSLCVLSGNFTILLWQKMFNELQQRFQIPSEAALPYLKQIMHNLEYHPEIALTGPLDRNDQQTIAANLLALDQDPYQQVYSAFVNAYRQMHHSKR